MNFLDTHCNDHDAQVAIISVPYEASVSYLEGTSQGPAALIAASAHVEEVDEESGIATHELGFVTLPPLEVADCDATQMVAQVHNAAIKEYHRGRFVLTLGGEHTISVGAFSAAHSHAAHIGLLHFDAHHDLRLEYWGSKYSHACVVRRIIEQHNPPVTSIGVRAFCPDERRFAEEHPVPTCYAWQLQQGLEFAKQLIDQLPPQIYLSCDVDVLDPAIMPSTGTPEPDGLSYRQLHELIAYACRSHTVVGADIVELSPRSGQEYASYTAAKLASQILAHALGSHSHDPQIKT